MEKMGLVLTGSGSCAVRGTVVREKNDALIRSWMLAGLSTLAGGFLASYTFVVRGGVFAFAQSGNLIYLGQEIMRGSLNLLTVLKLLLPVFAYMAGLFLAGCWEEKWSRQNGWQKKIIFAEMLLMCVSFLLPQGAVMNRLALSLLGLVCGLHMCTFHRAGEFEYTSIMCMGNMKRTVDALRSYLRTGDPGQLTKSLVYVAVNMVFCLGAAAGYGAAAAWGTAGIFTGCLLLLATLPISE